MNALDLLAGSVWLMTVNAVCVWQSIQASAKAMKAAKGRPYMNGSAKKHA